MGPMSTARPRTRTRTRLASLLLVLALSAHSAVAKDEAQAEHDRLSDEIELLAQRQVWSGVERKYRDLERLGTTPTVDDLMFGATAAREFGDVEDCYERLQAAAKLKEDKQIVDWLWDIDHNYGHVELLTTPSRSAELSATEMPLDPNQRKAVEAAIASAEDDGVFVGMLPKGAYTFATQSFQVDPGVAVHIEVSPRMRRKGLVDPVIIYRDDEGNPSSTPPTHAPPVNEAPTDGMPGDQDPKD